MPALVRSLELRVELAEHTIDLGEEQRRRLEDLLRQWRRDAAALDDVKDRDYAQACRDHAADLERVLTDAR